jgi:hypothetical protein
MYELKKNVKVITTKFVGTGPSSYKKRIYRAAVSQRLRNTALDVCCLPQHRCENYDVLQQAECFVIFRNYQLQSEGTYRSPFQISGSWNLDLHS